MAIKISQLTPVTSSQLPVLTDLMIINASGITKSVSLSILQLIIQGAGFQLNALAPNNLLPVGQARADGLAGQLGYTNIALALVPKGNGGLVGALADGTAIGGNLRGTNSVDWQTIRALASQCAAAIESTISGGRSNSIASAASDATISGGFLNLIGATATLGAVIAGGSNNSNNGGQACTVSGGQFNTLAGGNNSTVAGGQSNAIGASGSGTTIGGGVSNTADTTGVTIPGGAFASSRGIQYLHCYAGGRFSANGDAQMDDMPMRISTLNATPVAMTSNGIGTADATNQFVLGNNSAALVTFEVVARDTANNNAGAYSVTALVKRGANAAATSIVGAPAVTTIAEDAGFAAGDFTISADTTNGALKAIFTGITATTTHAMGRARAVYVQ